MANSLNGRPWVLDTASTTVPVKQGQTFTHGFVFRNYTNTTSSQAVIKDGKRGVIVSVLDGNSGGTPVSEAWFTNQPINDLLLSALDSGQVEVIIK